MPIVPPTNLGKIQFYEQHVPIWQANATAIGLTSAMVATLNGMTTNARSAYDTQQSFITQKKSATQSMYDFVSIMAVEGAEAIAAIKLKAAQSNDPNVYTIAQIPPPSPPTPVPAPGTPFDPHIALLQTGAIVLSFKCNNPAGSAGVLYEIKRRIGGPTSSSFAFVGSSGERSFTDETLPAGSTPVTYQVTAVRSTKRGLPAQFTVTFGAGASAPVVEEETGGGAMALAA